MAGVGLNNSGVSDDYKAFVRNQYIGIKDDDSINSKEQFINAKKNILANPETSSDVKSVLKQEIAKLQSEIDTANLKEKYNRSADTFEFSSKKVQEQIESQKEESGFGKKAATGVASMVVPGLGQVINGQWGKAAGFAIGAPLLATAAFLANPVLGLAVGAGLQIANVVDAYRNA